MTKKIILNITLFLVALLVPYYLLYSSQDDILKMENIQVPLLIVFFIGSVLIIYLNNKHRKQDPNHKWLWIFFEVIGVAGLCYSGFILALLFLLRNCCGF